jgi:hypothetical protein
MERSEIQEPAEYIRIMRLFPSGSALLHPGYFTVSLGSWAEHVKPSTEKLITS